MVGSGLVRFGQVRLMGVDWSGSEWFAIVRSGMQWYG